MKEQGGEAQPFQMDVGDGSNTNFFKEKVHQRFCRPTILEINAGLGENHTTIEVTEAG